MGKKKGAATSSAAASTTGSKTTVPTPKKTAPRAAFAASRDAQCDWTTSTITKRDEKKMRSLELIFDDEGDVRLPGSDSRPNPPPDLLLCLLLYCTEDCLSQHTYFFGAFYFHMAFSSGS
jgi:hypothetical protein